MYTTHLVNKHLVNYSSQNLIKDFSVGYSNVQIVLNYSNIKLLVQFTDPDCTNVLKITCTRWELCGGS